jgi:hypothetical protein
MNEKVPTQVKSSSHSLKVKEPWLLMCGIDVILHWFTNKRKLCFCFLKSGPPCMHTLFLWLFVIWVTSFALSLLRLRGMFVFLIYFHINQQCFYSFLVLFFYFFLSNKKSCLSYTLIIFSSLSPFYFSLVSVFFLSFRVSVLFATSRGADVTHTSSHDDWNVVVLHIAGSCSCFLPAVPRSPLAPKPTPTPHPWAHCGHYPPKNEYSSVKMILNPTYMYISGRKKKSSSLDCWSGVYSKGLTIPLDLRRSIKKKKKKRKNVKKFL